MEQSAPLFLFAFLCLALVLTPSTLPATNAHIAHPHSHLRSANLHFFYRDNLDYMIFPGIPRVGSTPLAAPYGATFLFNNPITEGPDPSSQQIGTAIGTTIIASLDGLTSLLSATITLNTTKYKGTLSVSGVVPSPPISIPTILGGTGDFLFAQGQLILSPLSTSTLNETFRAELHLFWPPYVKV